MSKGKQNKFNIRRRQPEILLSISIMVSGREETTEKCIASLSRLRGRVPCELILTDTGCSEELRQRLQKRADKYIPFTWCNDFAAARNVGLKAATGKWFMFMDDDEWFENTAQMEQFFLSGEYKRYESASYTIRNYANMEGTIWRDTPITRMTRIRSNTQFFYPIHEVLWPVLEPVKQIEDYAHHYGYASEDPAVQKAKRERNLSLLLPAIEQDPGCMHHYLQAVSEYVSDNDYASAQRMAEQGIAHCNPERGENGNHIIGLYAAAVKFLVRQKKYEDALERGKHILETVELSDLGKTAIYCDLAIAAGNLDFAEECRKYLAAYLEKKDYFANHRREWTAQQTLILDACMEDFQYRKAMGQGFAALLALGNAAETESLLQRENKDWWMETVQKWYTLAKESQREQWKANFERMAGTEGIGNDGGSGRGNDAETAGGNVNGNTDGNKIRIQELYRALTEPEQETSQKVSKRGVPEQENAGEHRNTGQTEATQDPTGEMERLAVQLKGQIKLLMEQGQNQVALQTIVGLQKIFPADAELAEWRKALEEG